MTSTASRQRARNIGSVRASQNTLALVSKFSLRYLLLMVKTISPRKVDCEDVVHLALMRSEVK